MPVRDFWIERMYVMVRKQEKPGFRFYNGDRPWDGFVYFLDGEAFYLDEEKRRIPVEKGCFVFLRRGQKYGFISESGCEYVTTAFDLGEDETSPGHSLEGVPVLFHGKTELREEILELLRLWEDRDNGRRGACRQRTFEFYRRLIRRYYREESGGEELERAFGYIHMHYRECFTTEEIAQHCSLSPSCLRSKFRRAAGMSITEYREALRIAEAKNLLESGLFGIKDIALRLGFSDVYHFSKRFAAATGVPPGQYKKSFYTKKNS